MIGLRVNYSYCNIGKRVKSRHLLSSYQTAANIMKILSQDMYNRTYRPTLKQGMKAFYILLQRLNGKIVYECLY